MNAVGDVPANAATALARTVVAALVDGGVRHLVLCPGSRSAALAFAAYAADGAGDLTLHTRIDERTAAFLALGLARTSRQPVAVLTTSGTAAANLHPAVLEAAHSGKALVLLTADRPARLRGTGANQTTDQVKLFGDAVRLFADVPPAVPGHQEDEQGAGWRALVGRAVRTALGGGATAPGPVHLNLQFDGPLTPDVPDGWSTPVHEGRLNPPDVHEGRLDPPGGEDLASPLRTVVVAGDDAGPPARVLAQTQGWPLFAEPSSGSRTGPNAIRTYRLLLGDPSLADRVQRVIVAGHPTLSRPVAGLLSREDVEVVAVTDKLGGWTDPGHRVSRVVTAVGPVRSEYGGEATPPADSWLQEWLDRDADTGRRLDDLLAAQDSLTPQQVAGEVAAALPPDGLLFVGASNPVRDLDLMVPRYRVGDRRLVVANRGLAGIDGSVSSAVGAALGRPRSSRCFALLGDLTFLHDSTGLVLGPDEPRPDLTIAVVNDDGGSLFALLEQGEEQHASSYERLFGTPHGTDLEAVCRASGTTYEQVRDVASLRAALERPPTGIIVVEAVVGREDRRSLDQAIRDLV